MDWDLLSAFLLVAEAGGLSAAARKGGLSQPTLGRRIEALEAALGAPVFERTARGLALTDAGREILGHARAMRDEADAAMRTARQQTQSLAGSVRITASHVMATFFLPTVAAHLRRTHPELTLELSATDAIENLLDHQADIALRMTRPEQSTLVGRKLGEIDIGAYAHRRYLDLRGVPHTAADLAAHDIVGEDKATAEDAGLRALGITVKRAQMAVRSDDVMVRWQAVLAGAGIGFIAGFVGDAASAHGVERVLRAVPSPRLPVWVLARREVRALQRVRVVFDAMTALAPTVLKAR